MKIILASYQPISILHGGPRVQVLQTKRELERLGVNAELFDPWKHDVYDRNTLFHLFAANIGTFHTASILNNFRIPFVTSPIFFTRHSQAAIRLTIAVNKTLKTLRTGIWTNYEYTRQVCEWARAVLPNTTDEANLVSTGLMIEKKKIRVIPNGVEPRFEFGDPSLFKKKYGLENFILNVGHIGPERKNILNLIRALKKIDHPAVIIGKISATPLGRQCVEEANQAKNILLIDGLENDSDLLAAAYASCDVFALPSLFETPGIAALEAGLAGAKIVITPIGGTKDYFAAMAEYVDPYSVDSITRGIQHALNRKKDAVLKEHIKKEFLWSRVAEKTLAVYHEVFQ
jgi:glycosyltransferase involved in cell wall biosynthesis